LDVSCPESMKSSVSEHYLFWCDRRIVLFWTAKAIVYAC
jgi:hypothetical protein